MTEEEDAMFSAEEEEEAEGEVEADGDLLDVREEKEKLVRKAKSTLSAGKN